jgi:hypothetical protein
MTCIQQALSHKSNNPISFILLVLSKRHNVTPWSTSRHGRINPMKELRYPLNRKLGVLRRRSGRFGEEKYDLPLQEFQPRTVQPVPQSATMRPETGCASYKPYVLFIWPGQCLQGHCFCTQLLQPVGRSQLQVTSADPDIWEDRQHDAQALPVLKSKQACSRFATIWDARTYTVLHTQWHRAVTAT